MNKHYAKYGNTILKRIKCEDCKRYAFVIDGIIQCCDRKLEEFKTHKAKVMSCATNKRKGLSLKAKRDVLEKQKNRCLYCGYEFKDILWNNHRYKFYTVEVRWDHFSPFSYSYNNKHNNFVASCQICNKIKTNLMFETVEEVRDYVKYRRAKRGYENKDSSEMLELWGKV